MVFGHFKDFHLKVRPKMSFFTNSVVIVGHELLVNGISTNPEKGGTIENKMANTKKVPRRSMLSLDLPLIISIV